MFWDIALPETADTERFKQRDRLSPHGGRVARSAAVVNTNGPVFRNDRDSAVRMRDVERDRSLSGWVELKPVDGARARRRIAMPP